MKVFDHIATIEKLHLKKPDQEHCGIIENNQIYHFDNCHDDCEVNFVIDLNKIKPFLQKDFIIWHTHTKKGATILTPNDIKCSRFWHKPILMVKPDQHIYDTFDPNLVKDYDGRIWHYSYNNCYTIIQDFYKRELNIKLFDFYLDYSDQYLSQDESKFLKFLPKCGFLEVDKNPNTLRVGDIILTDTEFSKGWHASVIVKTYPSVYCLSQFIDRPSCYFPFKVLQKKLNSIWRLQPKWQK